jgi:hypothetical protein
MAIIDDILDFSKIEAGRGNGGRAFQGSQSPPVSCAPRSGGASVSA